MLRSALDTLWDSTLSPDSSFPSSSIRDGFPSALPSASPIPKINFLDLSSITGSSSRSSSSSSSFFQVQQHSPEQLQTQASPIRVKLHAARKPHGHSHHAHHHRLNTSFSESPTFMIVSGMTAKKEHCLVADAPDQEGSGLTLVPCEKSVKKMDGAELWRFMDNGALYTLMGKKCMSLVDGETKGGGTIELQGCDKAAAAGDGRSLWEPMPNSQLQIGKAGNFCLTLGPQSADIGETNAVKGNANISASQSSPDGAHDPKAVGDGTDTSYWASDFDPAEPVSLVIDFGPKPIRMSAVDIDWEFPQKQFSIETSNDGESWSGCGGQSYNDKWTYHFNAKNLMASKMKIVMNETHPKLGNFQGHTLYGIQHVRVMTRNIAPVVKECAAAATSADARDKFFLVEVTEFNPCSNPKLDSPPENVPATTQFEGGSPQDEGKEPEAQPAAGLPAQSVM